MELDAKDQALLAALSRNARTSVVALARAVGLSRSATQDRLARLERTGVIQGYAVQLGQGAAGPRVPAVLMVRFEPSRSHDRPIRQIMSLSGIVRGRCLSGDIDLLLDVECASVQALDALRAAVGAVPGVAQVTTCAVLQEHR